MHTETILTIDTEDTPGALGDLARSMAEHDVNLDGFSVERGIVHILTKDLREATAAIAEAGFKAAATEVFVVDVDNRPGAFAELATRLDEAGVAISNSFGMGQGPTGRIYIQVEHVDAARRALAAMDGAQLAA